MLKLLVVDDVAERISDIRQEVLFSFPGIEIEVLGACDVPEAIMLFHERKGNFDMIVLDLKLPPFAGAKDEEGGFYLLEQFTHLAPDTVYVLSSGSLADGECPPQHVFPPGFSPENFHSIPKSANREAMLAILRDLMARESSPQTAMVS
jgi:CheY-like chemotaxis protein